MYYTESPLGELFAMILGGVAVPTGCHAYGLYHHGTVLDTTLDKFEVWRLGSGDSDVWEYRGYIYIDRNDSIIDEFQKKVGDNWVVGHTAEKYDTNVAVFGITPAPENFWKRGVTVVH